MLYLLKKSGYWRLAGLVGRVLSVLILILFGLPLNVAGVLKAQPSIKFEHFSQEQGLSDEGVRCITQDKKGFMWFGAIGGLDRYDGYRFTNYRHDLDDSTSLSSNYIKTVFADRKGRVWIGTAGGGLNLFDPLTERFRRFQHDPEKPGSLSDDNVQAVFVDRQGVLWVGTHKGGLNRFDGKAEQFYAYLNDPSDSTTIRGNAVYSIYEDRRGALWVGTNKGLNRYDQKNDRFHYYPYFPENQREKSLAISIGVICEDGDGRLWIGSNKKGLFRFNPETKSFIRYQHKASDPYSLGSDRVRSILVDSQGELWIGTNPGGLSLYDREADHFLPYRSYPHDPNSLNSNVVSSIYEDRQGGVWIGTEKGLNRFDRQSSQFQYYIHNPANPNSLSGDRVSSIHEDRRGRLWVATVGSGLTLFNRKSGRFVRYRHDPEDPFSLSNDFINSNCILEDQNGGIWVGTRNGLNYFDQQKNRFIRYEYPPPPPVKTGTPYHPIQHMYKDRQGLFWLGTQSSLLRFSPETKQFYAYDSLNVPSFHNNWINAIREDQKGDIWIGTFRGLYRLNRKTGQFLSFRHDPDDPQSLSSDLIQMIYEDRQGMLWVGTANGLNRCDDREIGLFTPYLGKGGLAANLPTFGIQEDRQGALWLSTRNGLTKFDPHKERFYNYNKRDGLIDITVYGLHKSARSGELFANGEGLTIFHPDSIRANPFAPPVFFTRIKYYPEDNPGGKPLEIKGVAEKQAVRFSYKDRIISFEFAALNYHNTHKNQYAYHLFPTWKKASPQNTDAWTQLGTENKVTFADLSPGLYTLWIKGANDAGIWSDQFAELKIAITPPWNQTKLAYAFYALLLLLGLYALYRFQLRRRLEQAEARRLKELDALKTKLYANITHEFRAPLTIIQGMSDQILDQPRERQAQSVQMIRRNGAQLLRLANQMLDLRKLESGKTPIRWIQGDIIHYLRYIQESFHSLSESRNIRLHFLSKIDSLQMDYDADKLSTIVSNLLSNAIKHSQAGEDVYLTVEAGSPVSHSPRILEIRVRDMGKGIPQQELNRIFDRFYQADIPTNPVELLNEKTTKTLTPDSLGTGIGLALTKELIKLLGGEISVKSALGKGSEFIVRLPILNKTETPRHFMERKGFQARAKIYAQAAPSSKEISPSNISKRPDRPLVLIIEDNPDVTQFLITCLEKTYRLSTASNGQEGINKALEQIPDLIVSDVVMPEKDGFEVCGILKLDERTSHIPIILLTARADVESRIAGLKRGADAYLAKPFNETELLARLEKLLALRRSLQERYAASRLPYSPPPDPFLQKVRRIIENNLADPDFGILQLCRATGRSRAQLFRKIKALTGKSTSLFIRTVRLQKARELLITTNLNISEVAYEVGFKDLSYFSRTFSKEFGVAPSATRR